MTDSWKIQEIPSVAINQQHSICLLMRSTEVWKLSFSRFDYLTWRNNPSLRSQLFIDNDWRRKMSYHVVLPRLQNVTISLMS